jgi:hypothetical protein
MLTLFTIPKPFIGHIGVIQRNAILSWLHLIPKCEIILFGDEPGIKEIAQEFGIRHVPEIKKNEYGTPFLDDVFNKAHKVASRDILCYCNADIIFFNDLIEAVKKVSFREYLMVGERWDVDQTTLLDTSREHWAEEFLAFARDHHTVLNFPGMDYFIFPKGMLPDFPPFVVGRRGWDNWLIYHVRKRQVPVIDTTLAVHAIHQNHSYSHVPQKKGTRWEGPESSNNVRIVGNRQIYLWELADSDWVLTPEGLEKKPFSIRTAEQDLILSTPNKLHFLIEPFYLTGHVIKFGYLKLRERVKG